jgi:hypothetical protein
MDCPRLCIAIIVTLFCAIGCGDNPSLPPNTDGRDIGGDEDAAGDTADTDPVDAAPTLDTDTGPDVPVDPSAILFRYDPQGDGFYRLPWPSDGRTGPEGGPDLSDFPGRVGTLDIYLDAVETVRGFATMPVAYFGLPEALPEGVLPETLLTLDPRSPIQLVDLSPDGCGTRFPLTMEQNAEAGEYHELHTLQIANAVGTILEPDRTYGFVILKSFGEPARRHTPRPEAFDLALMSEAHLQPLRDCLPGAGIDLEEVAVATVFTTQDPLAEMQALRDYVMNPDEVETRPLVRWEFSEAWSRRSQRITTFEGTVLMPVFQDGQTPYLNNGGALVFDDDGTPVIQRWEEVDVAIAWREFDEPPPDPRPILVFEDGTGWEPWNHLRSNWVGAALNRGFIVASFIPQFHGGRAGFGGSTEIATYNLINPQAARGNFRQQAAEASYFLRLLREQIRDLDGPPPMDTDRVVYGGQSQGAMCGSIVAAVEDQYLGYSLNGLSSFFTLTILHRKDLIDFEFVVTSIFRLDRALDRYYPMLQMIQLGVEVVDPHNYAHAWKNDVFVINGLTDATTTKRGIDHLTMVANMPPVANPGWEVDEQDIWDGAALPVPIEDNVERDGVRRTLATFLDGEEGHFTVYRNRRAREMSIDFWTSAVGDGPRISHRREYVCDDGSDDDEDGVTDCEDPQCTGDPVCDELVCDDGLDDDGDGLVDCEDPACDGTEPCLEHVCDDGLDDDGDGLIDCEDPECGRVAPCYEEFCGDGEDDDGDGLVDCEDDQCARRAPCFEQNCGDGVDDDGDGAIDCDDDQCNGRKPCAEIDCEDGKDDDGDGRIDCADDECRENTDLCHETNCTDGRDNDFDTLRDCDDPDCLRSPACPELICDDGEDNDQSGVVDCEDPDCLGTEACPLLVETDCDDGVDGDEDGNTDCEDANCALDAACVEEELCADGDLGTSLGIPVLVGTLESASNDWRPGECLRLGLGADTPDLSLRWTAPSSGQFLLTTYGSEADTVLTLFPGDCDANREFGCHDDLGPLASSAIRLTIDEGQTVTIVISGFSSEDTLPFQLHIYPAP